MEKSNSGMQGHGMPIETKPTKFKPLNPNGTELKTNTSTSTTIHESKHFPFQVVEITTTKDEKEKKLFRVGMCGQFVSNKSFASKETTEKYISARPWELITNLVCLTIQNAFEYEKTKCNN